MKAVNNIPYKPISYFVVTFAFTWGLWWAASSFEHHPGLFLGLVLMGLLSPFVCALAFVGFSSNPALKKLFWNKLTNIRLINLKSLPVMLLLPIVSIILSIGISLLFGYSAEQFTLSNAFSFKVAMLPTLVLLMMAACFEELGWRGYAFESLHSKTSFFMASFIFGVLWALWHLPLCFVPGTYQHGLLDLSLIHVLNFFLSILPLAFIISHVCRLNRGSILSAILFHFIINISQELFMVEPMTKCIQTVVLAGMAAIIILLNKEMFFDRSAVKLEYNLKKCI